MPRRRRAREKAGFDSAADHTGSTLQSWRFSLHFMGRVRTSQRERLRNDTQLQSGLADMESLYNAGHFAEVITIGEPMSGLHRSPYLRGKVRLRVAQAYIQLGKPDLAKGPLAEARWDFEHVDDAAMLVECMAAEASIACVEQRPEAVGLATKALAACRSVRECPNALEVQILSSLGSSQLVAGQTAQAIATLEEAIGRSDPVVDMRRLGKLLGNTAIAYGDLGDLENAIRCSSRAVALFETLHDLVSLAREQNNLGCYLLRRGELTTARTHLEHSLKLFERTNLQKARGLALLSLCELCLAQDDPDRAMVYADCAIEAGESLNETWTVANARMWKGRVAARLGDYPCADSEFQIAATVLENGGLDERLVGCHMAYAELLESRGDLTRAYEQLKLAFRVRTRTNGSRAMSA